MNLIMSAALLMAFGSLTAETSEEALCVRRIIEFHKDNEPQIVKMQIREFLNEYPNSTFSNKINLILGDTHFREQRYQDAKRAYESITGGEEKELIREHYIETLFHLGHHSQVAEVFQQALEKNKTTRMQLLYAESLRVLAKANPSLLASSKQAFLLLLNTEYSGEAMLSLAEISTAQGDNNEAFHYYLGLAALHPLDCEEYLCNAAALKALTEPQVALNLIKDIQNPKAKFLVGQTQFLLNNYQDAYTALMQALESSQEQEAAAFLMLIWSAYHLQDAENVLYWSQKLELTYPNHKSLDEVAYICGLLMKAEGNWVEARNFFSKAASSELLAHKDAALYELAIAHYNLHNFPESRELFLEFIHAYPQNPSVAKATRFIIQNTLQILTKEKSSALQAQLAEDLNRSLNTPGAVPIEEKFGYCLQQCKSLYELKKFKEASALLEQYLSNESERASLQQMHLLLAMCYQQMSCTEKFIEQAEKTLTYNKRDENEDALRLNLYSSYLFLGKQKKEQHFFDAAAKHLLKVVQHNHVPVKLENQLWLANYYYNKVNNPYGEYIVEAIENKNDIGNAENSASIFEIALKPLLQTSEIELKPEDIYLEAEMFKLANVYGWLDSRDKQILLLKQLSDMQESSPKLPWKLIIRTQFSLAHAFFSLGLHNQALHIYTKLSGLKDIHPHILHTSKLMQVRLLYATMEEEKKNLDNPDVITVLKNLKDLQIRKNLDNEPIHLEAALDYVEIRSSLDKTNEMLVNKKFLLERAKESFCCRDDLCSKDYQESLKVKPEKERIYQAYIMLMDAKIALIQAQIAAEKNDDEERHLRASAAQEIFTNLLNAKFAVSKYIIDQAKSGLLSEWIDSSHADSKNE